jgi:hypothetical protein
MPDVTITITAKTMEGSALADPKLNTDINEVQPFQRLLGTASKPDFDGQVTFSIPAPQDSNPEWSISVTLTRFMPPDGQFFFPLAEPEKTISLRVVRSLSAWNPRFTPFEALASPRFDVFKDVVKISKNVDLKSGPAVGDLLANYDALDFEPQRLAKTALLNLHSVLTDELDPISNVSWFSYVKKIVRIDQERFVAEVQKELFDHVRQIVDGLDGPFAGRGYSTESEFDFPLHYGNVPERYGCPANLAEPMVTVKKKYEQGDVQLTMSSYTTGEFLLDCDMDEHLTLLAHTVDLTIHLAEELAASPTAGTHPFLMHEYIVLDSSQQAEDGVATVDLGYVLV